MSAVSCGESHGFHHSIDTRFSSFEPGSRVRKYKFKSFGFTGLSIGCRGAWSNSQGFRGSVQLRKIFDFSILSDESFFEVAPWLTDFTPLYTYAHSRTFHTGRLCTTSSDTDLASGTFAVMICFSPDTVHMHDTFDYNSV